MIPRSFKTDLFCPSVSRTKRRAATGSPQDRNSSLHTSYIWRVPARGKMRRKRSLQSLLSGPLMSGRKK